MRCLSALVVLVCAAASSANVLDVPGTWPTIQQALDHAKDGDTVLVQPGTYHEALVLPARPLTLQSAGGAAVTIIDASGLASRAVTFDVGPPFALTTAILGFTLTGGNAQLGGGVYLNDSQGLALQDCVITGNTAGFGGGIYALGDATLVNCQLVGNHASFSGGGLYGPQLHLDACLLSGNVAGASGGGGYYGYYQHCSFEANVAAQDGGGVAGLSGGSQIVDCSFRGNVAGGRGGGAALSAFGIPFGFVGVAHCSFVDNQAHSGGGAWLEGKTSGNVVILSVSSCLFSGNAAVLGDGALTESLVSSTTCVRFCDFVGDGVQAAGPLNADHCIARDPPPGGPFVSMLGSSIAVTWSDVQGGWPGLGNFDADPQFLAPLAPDLHLAFTSPCVDAGDPAFVASGEGLGCGGPTADIDGQPRIQHGRVDVGADESEPDCNGNGIGDLHDVAAGTSSDCDADGVPDECEPFKDCNANGVRDACDIANGTSADCNGNGIPDECELAAGVPVPCACYANCDGSTAAPVLNMADFGCFLSHFAAGDSYANCDASTQPPVLNIADFACFLNRFAAGDSRANCDGSTTTPVLNVADFACFLNAFAAGCTSP
jgi:predicted outer membrane repeat protein